MKRKEDIKRVIVLVLVSILFVCSFDMPFVQIFADDEDIEKDLKASFTGYYVQTKFIPNIANIGTENETEISKNAIGDSGFIKTSDGTLPPPSSNISLTVADFSQGLASYCFKLVEKYFKGSDGSIQLPEVTFSYVPQEYEEGSTMTEEEYRNSNYGSLGVSYLEVAKVNPSISPNANAIYSVTQPNPTVTEPVSILKMVDVWKGIKDEPSVYPVKITIKVSDNKSYTFITYTSTYWQKVTSTKFDYDFVKVKKSFYSGTDLSYTQSRAESYYSAYRASSNTEYFLKFITEQCLKGILAASIGEGFNVGIPYSTKQRSLDSIMADNDNDGSFEFKSTAPLSYTLNYYFHPFFGKFYRNEEPYLPNGDDAWTTYLVEHINEFVTDAGSLNVRSDFIDFKNQINSETINKRGEKISDVTIPNGQKRFAFSGSKDPKSVISYNMPIATPYVFLISGEKGYMLPSALNKLKGYTVNIIDGWIYESTSDKENEITGAPVANLFSELMINRKNVYLYNQITTNEDNDMVMSGVVVVASFDEVVVDTTSIPNSSDYTEHMYLTGRKINFDNGYSESLYMNKANANLMNVQSKLGTEGYVPMNVSFPAEKIDLEKFELLKSFVGAIDNEKNKEFVDEVKSVLDPIDKDEMYSKLYEKSNHVKAPNVLRVVYMYTDFGKFSTSDNELLGEEAANDNYKYALYMIRNNAYINDASLLAWLQTPEAHSIPGVKADELYDKITGNFTNKFETLSYEDWKNMKELERIMDNKRDLKFVSALNVGSMVVGMLITIYGFLLLVFYFFDVFNPFDMSLLQIFTFNRLYPVANEDMKQGMSKDTKDGILLVSFKDVLIRSILIMLLGVAFYNVTWIMYIINRLYGFFANLILK